MPAKATKAATAGHPALARAMADCTSKAIPTAAKSTAAPNASVATADCRTLGALDALAAPTAFCPALIPNSFAAKPMMPLPAIFSNDPAKEESPGAMVLTTFNARNAPATFPTIGMILAIVSACFSINPATDLRAFATVVATFLNVSIGLTLENPPFTSDSASLTAENADENASPTPANEVLRTFQYFAIVSTADCTF